MALAQAVGAGDPCGGCHATGIPTATGSYHSPMNWDKPSEINRAGSSEAMVAPLAGTPATIPLQDVCLHVVL